MTENVVAVQLDAHDIWLSLSYADDYGFNYPVATEACNETSKTACTMCPVRHLCTVMEDTDE